MKVTEERGWLCLSVIAVGWFAVVLTHDIARPWINYADFNGVVWSQSAHNNLRQGLGTTLGVSTGFYFGPLPIPAKGYYTHHPTGLPMVVTAVFALLGEHEWAARLVPILCSLVTVVLLWKLVRECAGMRAAALSLVIFTTLPMELHFGTMVNHEPVTMMWIVAGLTCLRRWRTTKRITWAFGLLLCSFLGMWMAWQIYPFVLVLICALLFMRRLAERRLAWAMVGTVIVAICFYLTQVRLVRADAWQELWNALMFRTSSVNQQGSSYTMAQWCRVVGGFVFGNLPPVVWALASIGTWSIWRRTTKSDDRQWLGGAIAVMFACGAAFVVLLRNWSYIHGYASFYLSVPLAMAAGVGLDWALEKASIRWENSRLVAISAALVVLLGLVFLGFQGFHHARDLDRKRHSILDWKTDEPRDLVPVLGEAIRRQFPEGTLVLCNFLPAYGPHLYYYSQRNLWNDLYEYSRWKPVLDDPSLQVGGVVWLGSNGAEELLASLPKGRREFFEHHGLKFCFWHPDPRN